MKKTSVEHVPANGLPLPAAALEKELNAILSKIALSSDVDVVSVQIMQAAPGSFSAFVTKRTHS